jgi:hypothetical protein
MVRTEVSVDAKKRSTKPWKAMIIIFSQGFCVIDIIKVPLKVNRKNTRWLLCNNPKNVRVVVWYFFVISQKEEECLDKFSAKLSCFATFARFCFLCECVLCYSV